MTKKIAPLLCNVLDEIVKLRGLSFPEAYEARRELRALLAVAREARRAPVAYGPLCRKLDDALDRLTRASKGTK